MGVAWAAVNHRKMQQRTTFKHRVKKSTFRKRWLLSQYRRDAEKRVNLTDKANKSRTVDSLRVPPLAPARGAWLI
jgi:hypothetical protein